MIIDKCILIGDTHFGKKGFNKLFFYNQLSFFKEQLIPYMISNNIDTIIQTGDLFDNRVVIDISFLDMFCNEFIGMLQENNIKLVTMLGNHDIYYKNTTSVNLVKYIEKMYDNVISINSQTSIQLCGKKCLLVPWLLEGENIQYLDEAIIIGHFEIKNFQLSRGNIDEKSNLSQDTFKKFSDLEKVYSGHYHINQQSDLIHYVGVPYELDWGDFGNVCGFYHLTNNETNFVYNTTSKRHIKIEWDENKPLADILSDTLTSVPFDEVHKNIEDNSILKITNHYSTNNSFEELLFKLKERNIDYTFYNNQELQTIINPNNIELIESKLKNTNSFVLDYIKENHPELESILQDILKEVE